MGAAETEGEVWASVDRAEEISLGKDLNQETSKVHGDTVLKGFISPPLPLSIIAYFFEDE